MEVGETSLSVLNEYPEMGGDIDAGVTGGKVQIPTPCKE